MVEVAVAAAMVVVDDARLFRISPLFAVYLSLPMVEISAVEAAEVAAAAAAISTR